MKRSLYVYLLKQETFKNKTLKRPNHTCIYTVVKVSSKKQKTSLKNQGTKLHTKTHEGALTNKQ